MLGAVEAPAPYDVVAVNLEPDADNRIHSDEVAKDFGFAGALVPGVELFAIASTPLLAAWGEAFLRSGRLALRFVRPVYDGERVTVGVADGTISVAGPEGDVRAEGTAEMRTSAPTPLDAYDDVPLPPAPAARPELGEFGTVVVPTEAGACADYARRIGDPSPVAAEVVHPGLMLRAVNAALMCNVALGPWIHTASDCRFLGLARPGATLTVHSRVTELFERRTHQYVRYVAVVLADGDPVAQVDHEAIWRVASG